MGEWLHAQLIPRFGLESEEWAKSRLDRVTTALNAVTRSGELYITEVLWLQEMIAFTAPGPYVYVSRNLLERLATDDAAAFIVAHEIAHHELGHCSFAAHLKPLLRTIPKAEYMAAFLTALNNHLFSQEDEFGADALGLELCLAAGYDWSKCREAYCVLEQYLLDHGQLDAVYGYQSDAVLTGHFSQILAGIQSRVEKLKHSHPPLLDRLEALDNLGKR